MFLVQVVYTRNTYVLRSSWQNTVRTCLSMLHKLIFIRIQGIAWRRATRTTHIETNNMTGKRQSFTNQLLLGSSYSSSAILSKIFSKYIFTLILQYWTLTLCFSLLVSNKNIYTSAFQHLICRHKFISYLHFALYTCTTSGNYLYLCTQHTCLIIVTNNIYIILQVTRSYRLDIKSINFLFVIICNSSSYSK